MEYTKFVQQYKVSKDKEAFVKKHITKTYVPYVEKISKASGIALGCTHAVKDHPELYKKDTPSQYFATIMRLVEMYTDITYADADVVKAFDAMAELGIIDVILSSIPENEVTQFRSIVDMCVSDIYENERDITALLDNKFSALQLAVNTLLESLQTTLQNVDLNELVQNNISQFPIKKQDDDESTDDGK